MKMPRGEAPPGIGFGSTLLSLSLFLSFSLSLSLPLLLPWAASAISGIQKAKPAASAAFVKNFRRETVPSLRFDWNLLHEAPEGDGKSFCREGCDGKAPVGNSFLLLTVIFVLSNFVHFSCDHGARWAKAARSK